MLPLWQAQQFTPPVAIQFLQDITVYKEQRVGGGSGSRISSGVALEEDS